MAMIRSGVTEGPNKHVHIGLYAIQAPAKSKQVLAMYVSSMKVLCMRKYSVATWRLGLQATNPSQT